MRDSGWNDILSNCMGAVAEFLLFESCGELLLKHMTSLEKAVDSWLSLWGTCAFLLVYLGFFFTLSVPLQKQTRLSDWDPAASLFVGSDGTARHAWKGQIAKLEIWNRGLPDEFARKLVSGDVAPESKLASSFLTNSLGHLPTAIANNLPQANLDYVCHFAETITFATAST